MLRLGWFSTGRGPGSRNLLREVMRKKEEGVLDMDISFVFCNWDNTEDPNPKKDQRKQFFDLAKDYGIPLVTISWKTFRPDLWDTDQTAWRNEYGAEIRKRIDGYDFDLGILAGYMLWMDDTTCDTYDMINLHPALPDGPKGTWEEVIWELIRTEADEQGSMIHLCTPEWDRGAALTYCSFPIRGKEYDGLWADLHKKMKTSTLERIIDTEGVDEPLFRMIREDGKRHEIPLIVSTIRQFADGTASIKGKRLYMREEPLKHPFDLSEEVNATLRK
ncbi:MAG: formyltransferase family protein [Candidatus Methanomethylophilaceae archaeon]